MGERMSDIMSAIRLLADNLISLQSLRMAKVAIRGVIVDN